MQNHLDEREEQRIEELSSHGPPPSLESTDRLAIVSGNSANTEEACVKASITLPIATEVARKLHRSALVAASIEIDRYAETQWQIRNDITGGYEAALLLEAANNSTPIPKVEVLLINLFTSDEPDTTNVHSTYSFVRGATSLRKEVLNDICSKTQTIFETAIK